MSPQPSLLNRVNLGISSALEKLMLETPTLENLQHSGGGSPLKLDLLLGTQPPLEPGLEARLVRGWALCRLGLQHGLLVRDLAGTLGGQLPLRASFHTGSTRSPPCPFWAHAHGIVL